MRQTVGRVERILAGMLVLIAVAQGGLIGLIARLFGRKRMARAMQLYLSHPKMQAGAAAVGIPDISERVGSAMSQQLAQTPDAIEWYGFVQHYGENPQPERVPSFLSWIQDSGLLEDAGRQMPIAGAIIALSERHPDICHKWKADFQRLFQNVAEVCVTSSQDRAGWNDYYMTRWFILRDDDTVSEIVRRTQRDGNIGATATWMALSVGHQVPAFGEALGRLGFNPKVDAEFDCGNTSVKVGPGPDQIMRIPKVPSVPRPDGMPGDMPDPAYFSKPTMQREAEAYAKRAIIADCGPYKLLAARPPGEHSNFWTFELTGPGFPSHGITVVGIDETCGRSIIGGLATAWRAGRIEGRGERSEPDAELVIPTRLEPGQPFEMEGSCNSR